MNENPDPITIDEIKVHVNKLSSKQNAKVFYELMNNCHINEFLKNLTIYFDQFLKVSFFFFMRFFFSEVFDIRQILDNRVHVISKRYDPRVARHD